MKVPSTKGVLFVKVAVVGAGSWGTALANVLAQNQNEVFLWARRIELAKSISELKENKDYLPGAKLSETMRVSSDLEEALFQADMVIMAVPSHTMSETARRVAKYLRETAVVVSASKGIEVETFRRMSQILEDELPRGCSKRVAVLSGPSHAEEVVKGIPTLIVAASRNKPVAEKVQDVFMNSYFRVYTNPDVVGVELGGALKNIIGLCSGIVEGLGFGDNSRAALMTRGIVEITRLAVKLGAESATLSGLAGIGDLIVTCSSLHSRNRRAGVQIGEGKKLKDILSSTNMVVEGVNTTKAAYHMAKRLNIEMPITQQAYYVLFEQKDPREAVLSLMTRKGKHEIEDLQ
jgi:glycerol-3-phosphate dehydrogenase (NAD(P)+)